MGLRGERSAITLPLSREQQESFCTARLLWAQNLARKKFGPDAVEYAGEGLYKAVSTYDGTQQSLEAWAAICVLNTARNRLEQFRGRPGRHSAKRLGQASLSQIDPGQLDLAHARYDDPAGRLIHDEQLHQSLCTIEQIDDNAMRWSVMGQLLGGYPATQANRIGRGTVRFDDLADLVDGAMLFGAEIEAGSTKTSAPRLSIRRARSQWRVLPWFIATVEQAGLFRLRLSSGPATVRKQLTYKSPAWRFLAPMARRWPSAGKWACAAHDTLSEPMVVMWAVSAFYRAKPMGSVKLSAPLSGERKIRRLIDQCRDYGLPVGSCDGRRSIEVPASRRAEVEAWLEQRVPRCVWDRGSDDHGKRGRAALVSAGSGRRRAGSSRRA